MILRTYQTEAVSAIWAALFKKNHVLCVAPCGAGKTETFIAICNKALALKPDIRIMILVNKVSLVEQTARRMNLQIPTSVYCGSMGIKDKSNVVVASVQSAYKEDFGLVNLVILDEAHRLTQAEDSQYRKLLAKLEHPKLKVIGFTATPWRATGELYGSNQFFDAIDYRITLEELWRLGFLVKPTCKRGNEAFETKALSVKMGEFDQGDVSKLVANEEKVSAQIKDAMTRLYGRWKVAWACANIEHAEKVRVQIGEDASIIHSKMSRLDREIQQYRFERTGTRHIVFVNVLSEGYDYPPVDAIVLMCPTRSPVKYVQTVGRGLRIAPGKTSCLILDYGGVIENCGPITDPRIPGKKESAKKTDNRMKFCPKCLEYMDRKEATCPICSHVFFQARRSTPQLTKTAFSGSITEYPTHIRKVVSFKMLRFKSANGNNCIKFEYRTDSLVDLVVSEYFVWDNPIAMRRLSLKLSEMGMTLKETLDETIAQKGVHRVPSQIEVVHKKFTEIKRVIFTA